MGATDDDDHGKRDPATDVVHLGRAPFDYDGFVNVPVYRGSTVLYPTMESLEKKSQPYSYGRRGTPTVHALENALTKLAGRRHQAHRVGISGRHHRAPPRLPASDHNSHRRYRLSATRQFCDYLLKRLGIETEYYDPLIGGGIAKLFRANTRLVYVESPDPRPSRCRTFPPSPRPRAIKTSGSSRRNTWASPLFCRPWLSAADVVIEAGTKYLGRSCRRASGRDHIQ